MKFSVRAKLICLTVFSSSLVLLLLLGTTHSASAARVKTNVPTKAAMPQPDGPGASGVIPRTQLPDIERARFAEEEDAIAKAKLAPREAELRPREVGEIAEAKKALAENAYAKQRAYGSSYRSYSHGSSYRPYSYGSSYRSYSHGSSYRPYSHGSSYQPYSRGSSYHPYSYGGYSHGFMR